MSEAEAARLLRAAMRAGPFNVKPLAEAPAAFVADADRKARRQVREQHPKLEGSAFELQVAQIVLTALHAAVLDGRLAHLFADEA